MTLREEVIREALSWKGTPFQHMQRCKGAGVDCGQYLIAVYSAVGLIPNVDPGYYPPDFYRHSTRPWYETLVLEHSDEIPGPPEPADVALFKFRDGLVFSHGAIVLDWPQVIHAFRGGNVGVIETSANNGFLRSLNRKFFRPRAFSNE